MKFPCILLALLLQIQLLHSQYIWTAVDDNSELLKSAKEREIIPEQFASFRLQFNQMQKLLAKAGKENSTVSVSMPIPLPDGSQQHFLFKENSCMSPILAAKYAKIKSFSGVAKDNKAYYARIDYGPMGFHAVIQSPEGTIYVDPYFKNPDDNYISYYVRDHKVSTDEYDFGCGLDSYEDALAMENTYSQSPPLTEKSGQTEQVKRKYRLAVTTTGEWGQNYGTVENVLSRIVTGVNRLNMIFENEMATTFELIDRNDELIFLDPATDPFQNANLGRSLINQNSFAINNIVGSAAYDIGHIFTISCSDGVAGIAALGSVCLNNKGNGVSCVGGNNISFFMVNTTAHEIGHQFRGSHSWGNCPNAQGQLSPDSAWEPGSGSTILSYAGVCGSQNLAGTNDDYFHVGNIDQMLSYINTTGSCAEEIPSGNQIPEISMGLGDGLTIPISTPFELEAAATDADDDILTYNWEQMDLGPVDFSVDPPQPLSSLGQPVGNAPTFRSLPPTTDPKRVFPRLTSIAIGGSQVELLPTYSRDLTFRFVVRDNHPGAGAIAWEEVELKADESAGPFLVTKPNSLTFTAVNESIDIEWDVANTDNEIIDCQEVDIYFSTDNGQSFPYLLAENTPNDGSETVILPNILTDEGKIKVKASNNVFFQINRSNIIVREPAEPGFYIDLAQEEFDICLPEQLEVQVNGTAFQGFDTPVQLDVIDAPVGVSFTFSDNPMNPSGNSTLLMNFDGISTTQSFTATIRGTSENADTISQNIIVDLTGTNFDDMVLQEPASGLDKVKQIPFFRWTKSNNAETYTLEISKSPEFGSTNIITESFLPDTSFIPQVVLDNSELYYWRVLATNGCATQASEIRTFGTVSLDCKDYVADNLPKNISFSGQVTVDGTISVFDIGEVADINIKSIKGQHSDVFQLKGSLISPNGTEAVMFDNNCFASTDLNIGFDSDSPTDFVCPLNSGMTIKPNIDDLSIFEGQQIDGDWIFRIIDSESGDGGQFTEYELEICASFEVDAPYLVNNNVFQVPTDLAPRLSSDFLLVGDDNNGPGELIYTLVQLPVLGDLLLNDTAISVGDQFTQSDIDLGNLRYSHLSGEEGSDKFSFTVIDGEGGWLDLTDFNIMIGDDFTSSIEDLESSFDFKVYPNPASNRIYIQNNSSSNEDVILELFNIEGKRLMMQDLDKSSTIDASSFESGLYILVFRSKSKTESQRIQILH